MSLSMKMMQSFLDDNTNNDNTYDIITNDIITNDHHTKYITILIEYQIIITYWNILQSRMSKERVSESSFTQIKSKIKVVFLGQQSTGKTSILSRFINDRFQESIGPTVGIDFMAKNLMVSGCLLRLQLWDTAGQQRFRSLIPSYLKDSAIAFIVFDLTNARSFQNIGEWVEMCLAARKDKGIVVLLGNKSDDVEARAVHRTDIENKAKQFSLPYYEISAKSGVNVKEAFQYAGGQFVALNYQNQMSSSQIMGEKDRKNKQMSVLEQSKYQSPQKNMQKTNKSVEKTQIKLGQTTVKKKKKGCC